MTNLSLSPSCEDIIYNGVLVRPVIYSCLTYGVLSEVPRFRVPVAPLDTPPLLLGPDDVCLLSSQAGLSC